MSDEPAEPRSTLGDALIALEREDLDFYGVEGLSERVARLKAEIARTEAKRAA